MSERAETLVIYGASDDLVEMEGVNGADEFNVNPKGKIGHAGSWLVTGADGVMRVVAFYDGVWHFSVAQADEGVPIPPWPLTITHHQIGGDVGYSTEVRIEVPAPAFVSRLSCD